MESFLRDYHDRGHGRGRRGETPCSTPNTAKSAKDYSQGASKHGKYSKKTSRVRGFLLKAHQGLKESGMRSLFRDGDT